MPSLYSMQADELDEMLADIRALGQALELERQEHGKTRGLLDKEKLAREQSRLEVMRLRAELIRLRRKTGG